MANVLLVLADAQPVMTAPVNAQLVMMDSTWTQSMACVSLVLSANFTMGQLARHAQMAVSSAKL